MSLRTAREVREQSGGEQRKEAKLEKKDEREKHYFDQIFKVVLSLGSSILPVCPPIEYSFLTTLESSITLWPQSVTTPRSSLDFHDLTSCLRLTLC